MTDLPAPETAAAVLGTAPDLPLATPTVATPAPAAPPPGTPDRAGQVHDPVFHEFPPRLNSVGCWAKLRGNAARKAKGMPPSGAFAGKAWRPAAPAGSAPATAPLEQGPPPVTSSTPPPTDLLNDAPPPIVDGVPVGPDPGLRPLERYAGTAAGAVDGTFGVAQLTMGQAWVLKSDERRSLVDATQRVLHHYQAPMFGPILELILILCPVLAKRRNDPETRSVLSNLLRWFKERNNPAPAADPYRAAPIAGSSASVPAPSNVPAAYADGPTTRPAVSSGKTAWIP